MSENQKYILFFTNLKGMNNLVSMPFMKFTIDAIMIRQYYRIFLK